MRYMVYNDLKKFAHDVLEDLIRQETENNLIISQCLLGRAGADSSEWFMCTVTDHHLKLQLVAMVTQPNTLLLSGIEEVVSEAAIDTLVRLILTMQLPLSSVLAKKELVEIFTQRYTSATGILAKLGHRMQLYKADKILDTAVVAGQLRLACEKEMYYLPYWLHAFNSDCGFLNTSFMDAHDKSLKLIHGQSLYIWENKLPVSFAAMRRRTIHGAVISYVYTPPHFRRSGYATACVAHVSKMMLENGYKFCCLFADMANPVSNSIYQKIGYRPVSECSEYSFIEKS